MSVTTTLRRRPGQLAPTQTQDQVLDIKDCFSGTRASSRVSFPAGSGFSVSTSTATKISWAVGLGYVNLGGTSGYSTNVNEGRQAKRGSGIYLCGAEPFDHRKAWRHIRRRQIDVKRLTKYRIYRSVLSLLMPVVLLGSCASNGIRPGGPLSGNDGTDRNRSSIRLDTPGTIAFGYNVVINEGSGPVTDVEATLGKRAVGTISARVEKILAIDLSVRPVTALGVGKWPSSDIPVADTTDLASLVIAPDRHRIEILLIVSAVGTGRSSWPQTVLSYKYGGHRYQVAFNNGLTICAPSSLQCVA